MRESQQHIEPDRGFTLVELLIVIVILGILATVSVFAVRGVTDQGQQSACGTEFRQVHTAQEIHRAQFGTYADENDLVNAGVLSSESALFDTSVAGNGYSVTSASSDCTESSAVGGGGTTAAIPGSQSAPTAIAYDGLPAFEYGGTGADELLVFGRGEAAADWAATTAIGMDVSRRVTFIDIDDIPDRGRLEGAVARANSTPPTAYALYVDDDSGAFDGFPSFADALSDVLTDPAYDSGPVHQLDADGVQNLAWVFLQYP